MSKGERSKEIEELEAKLKIEQAKPKKGSTSAFSITDEEDPEEVAEMQQRLAALRKFATGGPVGMTGPAHLTAGEMVLDNNAAKLFVKAAEALSGQNLMDLQRDKQATAGSSSTVVVNNTSTNQVNSSAPLVMPASGVSPSNGDVMNVRIIS